jgi:hypothetical protein
MFFDRVHELETQQQVLWDIINNNEDKPEIQIKTVHELHNLTTSLDNVYRNLPATTLEVPSYLTEQQQQ